MVVAVTTPPPTRNIRVLHVINSMSAGGAEHLLFGQILAGAHLWESAIVCIDEPGLLAGSVAKADIPLFSIGNGRRLNLRLLPRLREVVRRWAPDLLHLHLPRSGIVGRLAFLRRPDMPIVYTEHNLFEMYAVATRLLNTATYFRNDAAIAVSNGVRQSILAHVPARFLRRSPAVVRNGIDVAEVERHALSRDAARRYLDIPLNATVIGTVGNLYERKGHPYLIEAFAALGNAPSAARLIIIGSGVTRDDLSALATRRGVSDRVSIISGVANASRLLRAFDVFVLPSVFEGLPIALLEAMGLGVPSIAARVGGIPEVIDDEANGILVAPRDAGGLTTAIARLLADAGLRERLAISGREQIMKNFSLTNLVIETDACYRAILRR